MEIDKAVRVAKRLVQGLENSMRWCNWKFFIKLKTPMYHQYEGSDAYKSMTHYMNFVGGTNMGATWWQMDDSDNGTFQRNLLHGVDPEDWTKIIEREIPLILGAGISWKRIVNYWTRWFEFCTNGKTLLNNEPGFVISCTEEKHWLQLQVISMYCIARIFSIDMACHKHIRKEKPTLLWTLKWKIENNE